MSDVEIGFGLFVGLWLLFFGNYPFNSRGGLNL